MALFTTGINAGPVPTGGTVSVRGPTVPIPGAVPSFAFDPSLRASGRAWGNENDNPINPSLYDWINTTRGAMGTVQATDPNAVYFDPRSGEAVPFSSLPEVNGQRWAASLGGRSSFGSAGEANAFLTNNFAYDRDRGLTGLNLALNLAAPLGLAVAGPALFGTVGAGGLSGGALTGGSLAGGLSQAFPSLAGAPGGAATASAGAGMGGGSAAAPAGLLGAPGASGGAMLGTGITPGATGAAGITGGGLGLTAPAGAALAPGLGAGGAASGAGGLLGALQQVIGGALPGAAGGNNMSWLNFLGSVVPAGLQYIGQRNAQDAANAATQAGVQAATFRPWTVTGSPFGDATVNGNTVTLNPSQAVQQGTAGMTGLALDSLGRATGLSRGPNGELLTPEQMGQAQFQRYAQYMDPIRRAQLDELMADQIARGTLGLQTGPSQTNPILASFAEGTRRADLAAFDNAIDNAMGRLNNLMATGAQGFAGASGVNALGTEGLRLGAELGGRTLQGGQIGAGLLANAGARQAQTEALGPDLLARLFAGAFPQQPSGGQSRPGGIMAPSTVPVNQPAAPAAGGIGDMLRGLFGGGGGSGLPSNADFFG
ncbi:hypothetical protein UFOVP411_49 [uncultured Caudovirales phage]|uniref:Uncharacterized protein n=1 Tax=uncultured Caudovirales phage TaxID=2100421 RepID=A0A6J5M6H2_9CAUD|nr:hypothetical protein UFOVP411_49 [uncultured Caudovirales phage]